MGRVYPTISLYRCNSGPVCRCVAFPHITCELPTQRVDGVAMFFVMQAALVAAVAAVPTVEIAPGVHMPMISLGPRQARSPHAQPLPTPRLTAQCPLTPHRHASQVPGSTTRRSPRVWSASGSSLASRTLTPPTITRTKMALAVHWRAAAAAAAAAAALLLALALALALSHFRTRTPTRP